MKYDHGTHAAYVFDKCRCDDCKRATRDYERERRSRIEPAYVSALPAREHVAELAAAGVGLKQIARASGVSHGALSKLMYGVTRDGVVCRPPSKRIRKATLDAILAVAPAQAAGGAKLPAEPTWQLIDEMIAAGVPRVRIAQHLGQTGPGLQLGRRFVTARNARAVRQLHDEWQAGRVELDRRNRHSGSVVVVAPPVRRERPDLSWELEQLAAIVERRNERSWRADAACLDRPLYLFFPARGDGQTLAKARAICSSCSVRAQCAAESMFEREGVYGGLSAKQRREYRIEHRLTPPPPPIEHSTENGYHEHVRRGEVACRSCKRAHAIYVADRDAAHERTNHHRRPA